MLSMNERLSELVGAIIGDGNLWTDGEYRYRVDINGHPTLDGEYHYYLSKIIRAEFDRKTGTQIRPHELVLRTQSKKVFDFLTKELGLPYGFGKGKKVTIPDKIFLSDWNILKCCIRGIADTDGSLFFARKKNYRDDYPSIEISTTSKNLAIQMKEVLISKGFRVGFRKQVPIEEKWNTRYIISLNGEKMLEKWMIEICFSNPRHYRKYQAWKAKNTHVVKNKTAGVTQPGRVSDFVEVTREGQN